jgi:tetratricopeptide (TPR) repeat protein
MLQKWSKFLLFFLSILQLFCMGCTSPALLAQRGPYLNAYHSGCLEQAEQSLDQLVKQEIPARSYTKSKEASWILLDRATTRFAMGKTEQAIDDYKSALEAIDYYNQDLPAEKVAQIMLQDNASAYQAADFEQVLARIYFALALLHQGDEGNAYALLRQAEEYQQAKQAIYRQVPFTKDYRVPENGLSKFLFATLLEKRGDLSNASILYKRAAQLISCKDAVADFSNKEKSQATVLVMCHNGNAPYKVTATSPASVASAAALEILLSATSKNDVAVSSLIGVPVPVLQRWPSSMPLPTYAMMDGHQKRVVPFYSVNQAAQEELQQKTPVIVARGVARLLLRRSAIGYLQQKDPCLGALADLTMYVVNSQTDADTRSWTTLPAVIDIARFNVEPGCHSLTIQVCGLNNSVKNYKLTLNTNDLCIIHVFNIHPGITQVLIPQRYLVNQELP